MTAQVQPFPSPEPTLPPPESPPPTLDQLLQNARGLLAEGADQARDIGDLAFMELELAVSSTKWFLLAALLLGMSAMLFCTFSVAALAVLLIDSARSAGVLFLCGLLNAIGACALFFWLKSLSKKMAFHNLRQQLFRTKAQSHGKD